MKVIIIKECKEGKVNDVVDVSAGYATNYLIKNKFALPFNSKTKNMLENKLKNISDRNEINYNNAMRLKEKIESIHLVFYLLSKNNVIHGSISKKQIIKSLFNKGIKINPHSLESIHIKSLGNEVIKIKIYDKVIANLHVEVKNESEK